MNKAQFEITKRPYLQDHIGWDLKNDHISLADVVAYEIIEHYPLSNQHSPNSQQQSIERESANLYHDKNFFSAIEMENVGR